MTPTLPLLKRIAEGIRTPRLRTMREFAEQEIVIPTGRYAGLKFTSARQPFTRLWFDAVDSGQWRRVATTGPSQTGKTLLAFIIPLLFHLFEIGETVIVGLPTLEIAGDKWSNDILPAIQASRYRDLLPRHGAGSRGGKSNMLAVRFGHGATMRFMSGGGDDKSRAHFTARVLVTTETDGLDESSEGSREADKVSQLEARTLSFDDRARIYHECTVSTEAGRIWQEITRGTDSRIAIRCPHCRRHVTPEREHFTGWQDAQDEIEAGEHGHFFCPSCAAEWSEEERTAANHDCLLAHRGQEITDDGKLTAQPPRTETLGFRWNACNNLLVKCPAIAKKEWRAARSTDEDNAAKELLQFWWAKPHQPDAVNLTTLDHHAIARRLGDEPRGRVPGGAGRITVGIDVGKYLCHWTAIAWFPNASPHVIEYGRLEVPSNDLGEERAILAALREFRDGALSQGWPAEEGMRKPSMVAVDCGNWHDVILGFCNESPGFIACKGFGVRQIGPRQVGEKTEAGWKVVWAPEGAGYELLQRSTSRMLDVRADHWKTWLHARIATPMGKPGAFTLHSSGDHLGYTKGLVAEKRVEEFIAGKGLVIRWERINRNNHPLDSTCLSCVAGHSVGERLIGESVEQPPAPKKESSVPASAYMNRRKQW